MAITDITTVLFLTADPSDAARLRLSEEQREIQEKIRLGNNRDSFLFEVRNSVRSGDFIQALHDTHPQILHFSGHGTPAGELCLENDSGKVHSVTPNALTDLFKLVADQVQCVILNACYSEIQATAIAKHVKYVIGMNKEIGDRAAIVFSVGFYRALAAGNSFTKAYQYGLVELKMLKIEEHNTPILLIQTR